MKGIPSLTDPVPEAASRGGKCPDALTLVVALDEILRKRLAFCTNNAPGPHSGSGRRGTRFASNVRRLSINQPPSELLLALQERCDVGQRRRPRLLCVADARQAQPAE